MATARMWWGVMYYWPPPPGLTVDWAASGIGLEISGAVQGPGCGWFECSEYWYSLRFLSQYFLGVDRMPDEGCIYSSAPYVRYPWFGYQSSINLSTGGRAIFDEPSAGCWVTAGQQVYEGSQRIGGTSIVDEIWHIDGNAHHTAIVQVPSRLEIPPFSFTLNRSQNLQIDIEVVWTFRLEGSSEVEFERSGPPPGPFEFIVPQWDIVSLDV